MASKMQSTAAEYAAISTGETATRPNALSNRVTSVLSTSYADPEIREALEILDEQGFRNTPEARRQLRFQVQKEVIDCNSEIIRQFGHVSEVCCR
jgi:ketosteroid isomerase-like protein